MKNEKSIKGKFAFFIIFISLLSYSGAQAQYERTWSIGPEIGTNISKYSNESGENFKAGLLAGVGVTYSVENTYGFTGKLLFSQKGSEYTSGNVKFKQTLNYLELPIIGRFFLNPDGRFRPNVFLGPSFALLLDVKNKREGGESTDATPTERSQFNDFDFGLTGGIGLNYEILNETRILLDARYTQGLLDIRNPGSVSNQAIGVTLGMSFGF